MKTDADEYAGVERMYMAAGDMDKDIFCRCWRQTDKNPLTQVLFRQAEVLKFQLEERMNELDDVRSRRYEMAVFLIGKSCAYKDTDFYREAVRLVGQREVTRMKLEMDLPLWDDDKKLLRSYLSNEVQDRKFAG